MIWLEVLVLYRIMYILVEVFEFCYVLVLMDVLYWQMDFFDDGKGVVIYLKYNNSYYKRQKWKVSSVMMFCLYCSFEGRLI